MLITENLFFRENTFRFPHIFTLDPPELCVHCHLKIVFSQRFKEKQKLPKNLIICTVIAALKMVKQQKWIQIKNEILRDKYFVDTRPRIPYAGTRFLTVLFSRFSPISGPLHCLLNILWHRPYNGCHLKVTLQDLLKKESQCSKKL